MNGPAKPSPVAGLIVELPDGSEFHVTRVFGDGTYAARMSPPLKHDGTDPDPSQWASGLYSRENLLIAGEDASAESITSAQNDVEDGPGGP